jgi:ABC-type amino acid transport substrate-binding protein
MHTGTTQPPGKLFEFSPYELIDPVILGYGTGAAMRRDDTRLKAEVDAALKAVCAKGQFKKIVDQYFDFDGYGK